MLGRDRAGALFEVRQAPQEERRAEAPSMYPSERSSRTLPAPRRGPNHAPKPKNILLHFAIFGRSAWLVLELEDEDLELAFGFCGSSWAKTGLSWRSCIVSLRKNSSDDPMARHVLLQYLTVPGVFLYLLRPKETTNTHPIILELFSAGWLGFSPSGASSSILSSSSSCSLFRSCIIV